MYEDNCKGREGDDTKRRILLEITPVIGRIYIYFYKRVYNK